MRLPVPDRFSPKFVLLFCLFLFIGQQITGTDVSFSIYTVAFVVFAAIGFNVSGGLFYASGAFIFFNALLTAIFGLTYKIFLNEPGQKTLLDGDKSMLVYAGGMFSMMCAAALSARLRPRRSLLGDLALGAAMKRAAAGCLIFGAILAITTTTSAEGSIGSAFRQVNRFLPMAILLGTTYQLQVSNGRKATNWVVFSGMAMIFAQGLISFSKEGMFTGPVCWIVACIILGYDFKKRQLLLFAAGSFFAVYYLVPYSQYVRNFATGSRAENVATAITYLSHLGETRELYVEQGKDQVVENEPHLYAEPQNFFDRLNMLAFDDAIIKITDEGRLFGITPAINAYANILPHFIWKNKPHFAYGNVYAHEFGLLSDEDETTGISFSPAGDAYHEAGWYGIFLLWPLIAFLFFLATDSLTGSTREAPWALLPISISMHAAPEGMLGSYIFLTTYGIVMLLVVVFFSRYVLPVFTSILSRGSSPPIPRLASDTLQTAAPNSRI